MSEPTHVPFEYKSEDSLELLDSEILQIEAVMVALNRKAANGRINIDAFDKEIVDRFANAGWKVKVDWYSTNVAEVYLPEIVIQDRLKRDNDGLFDHERMQAEVQTDILDLGTGGKVQVSQADLKRFTSGSGG
jgi:hypothetical protein